MNDLPPLNTAPWLLPPADRRPRATMHWFYSDVVRLATQHPDAFIALMIRQRKALGFSQRELSRRTGTSPMGINAIEKRKYATTQPQIIQNVLEALAINADDLRAEIAAMADREAA